MLEYDDEKTFDDNITDNKIKIIHHSYYKPDKSVDFFDLVVKAKDYIINLAKENSIDEFAIEDYIRFMKGNSSSATTIPLAILNFTLRISTHSTLGIAPDVYSVLKIRHCLKRDKELPKKEEIPELVASYLGIDYPWLKKFNKVKKVDKILEESYDMADAMAVALAHIKIKMADKFAVKKVRNDKKRSIKVDGVKSGSKARRVKKSV